MGHLTETELLNLALETASNSDMIAHQTHLENCEECQNRLEVVQNDLEKIKNIEIPVTPPQIPDPWRRNKIWINLAKSAAVLLIGFWTGFMTHYFGSQPKALTKPLRFVPQNQVTLENNFFICENIDLIWDSD